MTETGASYERKDRERTRKIPIHQQGRSLQQVQGTATCTRRRGADGHFMFHEIPQ